MMLAGDSIDVWRVSLSAEASSAYGLRARGFLSDEERARADAFHADGHRQSFMLAHAALRFVLGRLLAVSPSAIELTPADGTKPALRPVHGAERAQRDLTQQVRTRPDLRFNLSHTDGLALIAVAVGREVGVDVERHRPMADLDGLARTVMSAEEWKQWSALDADVRLPAFYHLWTRKEAYLKGIGLGLYRDLHEITVPVSAVSLHQYAGEGWQVKDECAGSVWGLRDIPVGVGYSGSLAVEGTEQFELSLHDFDALEIEQA